jgi:hypothetical protein
MEQREAALVNKTNSVQRGCASLQKDLRSLRREFNKAKDSRDLPKLTKLVEKRDLLKLKVQALEKEVEQFRAQQQKQLNLLEKALHEKHERMHGLLAYGMATGGLSPDAALLFNELGDFLAAKSESDRAAATKAIGLILDHGNVFGDKQEEKADDIDDRILAQFESIADEQQRTAFYQKHRDEIHRGFEARKNNP